MVEKGTTIWIHSLTKKMLGEYESSVIKSNDAKIQILRTVYDYIIAGGYSIPPDLIMKKRKG